jgi:uncharacterized protein YbbC (DUF1343 family)
MKKILVITSLLFSVLMANAQSLDESKEILQQEIEATSKVLKGKQVDFMTTCVDVLFDGKDVIYVYKVDETYCKLSNIDFNKIKETQTLILENNETVKFFMEHLKNIGGRLIYIYIGNMSYEMNSIMY